VRPNRNPGLCQVLPAEDPVLMVVIMTKAIAIAMAVKAPSLAPRKREVNNLPARISVSKTFFKTVVERVLVLTAP
jgi:hypothetical protein